jgi:hypothetical protein
MVGLYKLLGSPIAVYYSQNEAIPFQKGYLVFSHLKNAYYVIFFDHYSINPNAFVIKENVYKIEQIGQDELDYSLDYIKAAMESDYSVNWRLDYSFNFGSSIATITCTKKCINCRYFSLLNFFCDIQRTNKKKDDCCPQFTGYK